MFNGTISSSAPTQTFAVFSPSKPTFATHNNTITTSSSSTISSVKANSQLGASLLQSLPCHLLAGQTSLVLTPVPNGSGVTCTPLALTLTNQVLHMMMMMMSLMIC